MIFVRYEASFQNGQRKNEHPNRFNGIKMNIIHFQPQERKYVSQFLQVAFQVYRDIHQWVPPLSIDQKNCFNPRNPFYQHSKAAFFLAVSGSGTPLSRLVIINNRNYNEFNQEKTAFFWMFESIDDEAVSQTIFAAGFEWARSQGLDKIIGPKGFTALDGSGLLVSGFEHRPAFGLPYNPDYYPRLAESAGFKFRGDTVSGYLSSDTKLPEKIHQVADLVKKKKGLWVAQYKHRKDLRALVPKLKDLYNDALDGTTGNVPITDEEAQELANQMLRFADPKLIKIVMKGGEPIGFLFAYPDVSEAIQKINGRVFPFGWISLLRAFKTTEWVNINGAGIAEKHRGTGATALLFSEIQKSIQQSNFKHVDLVQIGVDNDRMQRELRDLGIDFYKTHRLYEKEL
jgi:hypothetical protein